MESAITTALTAAATDATGVMLKIIPVALGVFAIQWGVRKGVKMFKSVS